VTARPPGPKPAQEPAQQSQPKPAEQSAPEPPVARSAEPSADRPGEVAAPRATTQTEGSGEASPVAPVASASDSDTVIDPLQHAETDLDERASRKAERDAERAAEKARRREEKRQAQLDKKEQKEQGLGAPAEALVARLPAIKPLYAAIISGAIAGLAVVLLAIGASEGCEAVRGTSSCGGGVGLLATVALLAIEVLIGANLLKAWQISDPFSTSFLGVGVVATVAMLIFLDQIDSVWMLLVIPLATAAAFAGSWWVTVRFVDEHPMASEVDAERGEPTFAEQHDEDSTG
jgi:hypothetical protein